MGEVVDIRGKARAYYGPGDGGGMDDILKRLGAVEESVSEIKAAVSGLTSTMPHLATKADVQSVETSIIKWIVGTIIAVAALAFAIAKSIH